MNQTDFNNLTQSIRQAGKIRGGSMKPSRSRNISSVDVRLIRKRLGKSQREFALMIGVSVATLQNWEQGRRKPEGPAQALLKIAEKNPKAIAEVLGA
ncbi:MAG: NadS family protein [Spirochaetota bacterium]